MASEKLSARQLSVAVMVGGLSLGAAAAGGMDWRWALLTVAPILLLGWLLLNRARKAPLFQGAAGGVLAVLYCGWAVVLMGAALRRAAQRLQGPANESIVWLLLLVALPLLWMGWGKAAPFFRAVEIFWLAMAAALFAILALGFAKIDWHYLRVPGSGWRESMAGMENILSVGLFVLPYIYKVERRPGDIRRGLGWLGALGLVSSALAALTAGLLSPAVVSQVSREPFFIMGGLLGGSARLEGFISVFWLLADLTLVGLLSRVWGARRRPAVAVVLAFIVAMTGVTDAVSPAVMACGNLILAVLVVILPNRGGKIVVDF